MTDLEDAIKAEFDNGCEGIVLAPSRKDSATGEPAAFQCIIYTIGASGRVVKNAIRGTPVAALRAALADEPTALGPKPEPEPEDVFG